MSERNDFNLFCKYSIEHFENDYTNLLNELYNRKYKYPRYSISTKQSPYIYTPQLLKQFSSNNPVAILNADTERIRNLTNPILIKNPLDVISPNAKRSIHIIRTQVEYVVHKLNKNLKVINMLDTGEQLYVIRTDEEVYYIIPPSYLNNPLLTEYSKTDIDLLAYGDELSFLKRVLNQKFEDDYAYMLVFAALGMLSIRGFPILISNVFQEALTIIELTGTSDDRNAAELIAVEAIREERDARIMDRIPNIVRYNQKLSFIPASFYLFVTDYSIKIIKDKWKVDNMRNDLIVECSSKIGNMKIDEILMLLFNKILDYSVANIKYSLPASPSSSPKTVTETSTPVLRQTTSSPSSYQSSTPILNQPISVHSPTPSDNRSMTLGAIPTDNSPQHVEDNNSDNNSVNTVIYIPPIDQSPISSIPSSDPPFDGIEYYSSADSYLDEFSSKVLNIYSSKLGREEFTPNELLAVHKNMRDDRDPDIIERCINDLILKSIQTANTESEVSSINDHNIALLQDVKYRKIKYLSSLKTAGSYYPFTFYNPTALPVKEIMTQEEVYMFPLFFEVVYALRGSVGPNPYREFSWKLSPQDIQLVKDYPLEDILRRPFERRMRLGDVLTVVYSNIIDEPSEYYQIIRDKIYKELEYCF